MKASSNIAAAASPLTGRRIVVTRAVHQAKALADGLRAEGAIPLLVPAITTRPALQDSAVEAALRTPDQMDWIVWTSPNGVHHSWPLLRAAWPHGLPPEMRLAVVGPGTAQALAQYGLSPHFVPQRHLADELAATLPLHPGSRVLLCRGDLARATLPTGLAARGAEVTDVTVYRTVPGASPDALRRALAQDPDAITFTSASTVQGFVQALREMHAAEPRWPDALRAVAIGPVTARAMADAGVPVDAVAARHTLDGLLDALRALYHDPS